MNPSEWKLSGYGYEMFNPDEAAQAAWTASQAASFSDQFAAARAGTSEMHALDQSPRDMGQWLTLGTGSSSGASAELLRVAKANLGRHKRPSAIDPMVDSAETWLIAELKKMDERELQDVLEERLGTGRFPVINPAYPAKVWEEADTNIHTYLTKIIKNPNDRLHGKRVNGVRIKNGASRS